MAARHKLMKVILREMTEDETYSAISDMDLVYSNIRALQQGHFNATKEKGVTVISASHGNKSFSFQVADGFSPTDIMEVCEDLLELIEPYDTVAEIRQRFLRRRRSTKSDFSTFNP